MLLRLLQTKNLFVFQYKKENPPVTKKFQFYDMRFHNLHRRLGTL